MKDIYNVTYEQLNTFFTENGISKFKTKQVYDWLYKKGVTSFEKMTNLSKSDRELLKKEYTIGLLSLKNQLTSNDGTNKFLFELDDHQLIETVLMEYKYGLSICISSQVGCKMGCDFCASAKAGFARDLTAGEMIAQIMTVNKVTNQQIDRVVVMGIGEPFDNFDNFIKFIAIVNDHRGLMIGGRKLTVSTCGIVPKIYQFADLHLQVNLSISLHEVADDIRSSIMPINKKYPINELIESCKYYIEKTNRRISFEYALIGGLNDDETHALALSKLLKDMLCYVNVIPINKIQGGNYNLRKIENIEKFCGILRENGLMVTVRRELGNDINASCGQLRRSQINEV
ncbi:MAG: 23S rRNA (adenine(2503)-C(2))-methyltransferase RlmN [Clostridiales bacterium]|nr:23S rRNA (adenine(2503)-C(2))-methyltransferase RlmN [Clostridiales bacterium]